ncbi:MAG TPA: hypothetical protein VLX31_12740 [Streptosporangiaceae bacterium]|nr:hypothetical protein [Streptosporangiaceae bacterium]
MPDLDAKLQIRPGQTIAVTGPCPDLPIAARRADTADADVVLAFARDRAELDQRLPMLADAAYRGRAIWLAYPKAR